MRRDKNCEKEHSWGLHGRQSPNLESIGERRSKGNRETGVDPKEYIVQFSSVAQSCPTLCDPMNLSTSGITNSQSSPKPMSIESVMPPNHLILCRPLLLPPPIRPNIRVFSNAAAAAKSLQSCPTLCDPIDGSPTRFPWPWDSPGKNTGVGYHFFLQCLKVKSESEVAQSYLRFGIKKANVLRPKLF